MGFDSNGNFKRVSGPDGWKEDKSQDIKILASRHDIHDQDMAEGLNAALLADGRKAMSGSLKMGNNQVKNLAPGTAATDAVTAAQAQSLNFNYADDISSTANEVVIALSPGLTAQPNALFAVVKIANTNTGAATLKVNGLAAKRILFGTSEIYEGTLQAGSCYLFIYNRVLDAYQLIISGVNAAAAPLLTLVFSESLLPETQKYGLELQGVVCPRSKYWEVYDMLAAEYATSIDRTETVSGTTFAFKEATDTKRRFYEKEVYNERFTLCGDSGGYVLDTELQRFTLPKTKNFFRPNMDALLANVYNPDENKEHYHGAGERGPSNTGAFLENEDREAEAFDLVSPNTRGWNGSGGSAPGGTSSGNLHFITSYDKATDTNQVSPRSKNIFVYYRVGGYSASSVPAGTADYTNLSNLPSIGGKTLVPGMSLGDLGITDNALLAYKNLPETFGAVSLTEGVYKGTITNNIVFSLPTLSNPGRLTQIIAHLVIPSGKTVNFGTNILLRGSPTLPLDGTYFVIWTWHPQIAGWVCDVQKVGESILNQCFPLITDLGNLSGTEINVLAEASYKGIANGSFKLVLPIPTDGRMHSFRLFVKAETNANITFDKKIMYDSAITDYGDLISGTYYDYIFTWQPILSKWQMFRKTYQTEPSTLQLLLRFNGNMQDSSPTNLSSGWTPFSGESGFSADTVNHKFPDDYAASIKKTNNGLVSALSDAEKLKAILSAIGTGDFTIGIWVYCPENGVPPAYSSGLFRFVKSNGYETINDFGLMIGNMGNYGGVGVGNNYEQQHVWWPAADDVWTKGWHYLEANRKAGVAYITFDGILKTSGAYTVDVSAGKDNLAYMQLFGWNAAGSTVVSFQEFFILSKASHIADFAPPTEPFVVEED